MTRIALAATILVNLTLNGSMASASMIDRIGVCTAEQRVCRIALRMMVPPPPRPADLAVRVAAQRPAPASALTPGARVIPASASR